MHPRLTYSSQHTADRSVERSALAPAKYSALFTARTATSTPPPTPCEVSLAATSRARVSSVP